MDAVSKSFKDAICGKKYRRATWVCIALVIFDQMTGVTGLIIYANSLLVQMSEQGSEDFPLTPIQGTWLIAISTMFASSLPLLYNHKFGRKTLFMTGYLLMSFVLFMTGLSIYKEWNMAAFSFVICMIFCFQMLAGWLNNVYFVEVCVDTATGVVALVQAMTATITALSFDYMINSKLQVQGTFWFFSAFCFLGFLFHVFVVKETRGLSDLQKKTLYTPLNLLEPEKQASDIEL